MIRSQEHVRSIDVGHFLDDLVQFIESLLHGIERLCFRAGRVSNFVDGVVEDVDGVIVAHQGAAISFAVQFQKVFSLDDGCASIARRTQYLAPVFSPGCALTIDRYSRSVGVDGQLLAW